MGDQALGAHAPSKSGRPPLPKRRDALDRVGAGPGPLVGLARAGRRRCGRFQLVEQQLVAGHAERRQGGHLLRPRLGGGQVARALGEAQTQGRVGVEFLGRQQHGPGRAGAGQQGQALHRPVVDHQAQFGGRDGESGGRVDDAQVAGQGQLGARPEGGAVHGGDDRDGNGHDHLQQVAQRRRQLARRAPGRGRRRRRSGGPRRSARSPGHPLQQPPPRTADARRSHVATSRALRRSCRSMVMVAVSGTGGRGLPETLGGHSSDVLFLILSILILGLIVGALGRLLVPGHNPMGILVMTALVGIGGALIGGVIARLIWPVPANHRLGVFVCEVLGAALIVALVSGTRRRPRSSDC